MSEVTALSEECKKQQSIGQAYASAKDYSEALNAFRRGHICSPGHYGTASILNMETGEFFGSTFPSLKECLDSL